MGNVHQMCWGNGSAEEMGQLSHLEFVEGKKQLEIMLLPTKQKIGEFSESKELF